MNAARLRLAFVASVALAALVACADARRPPNVLLISLDTTRADHCSVNGYARDTTPNLVRLAAEGARFPAAYAPSATTAPSHATLFTSLAPPAHGVVKNGVPLGEQPRTLAETLGEAGYQTAAIVSSFVLTQRFGWARGFERYVDYFDRARSSVQDRKWEGIEIAGGFDRRADETTRLALDWLAQWRAQDRPFFLFVHYFDPHSPYDPPAEFAERFAPAADDPRSAAIARYDAEIAFTDAAVGELLAGLERAGLARDTVVIVSADHGEGLGQHGVAEHGRRIYEEAVRVPLIVRWPARIRAGLEIAAPAAWIDLAPTITELAGIARPPAWQGESLAPALVGGAPLDAERPIFLFRRHYLEGLEQGGRVAGEKYGVRVGRWKYLHAPDEGVTELYDLESDPGELRNLAETHAGERDRLAQQLGAWLASMPATRPAPTLDEGVSERMRALGYAE